MPEIRGRPNPRLRKGFSARVDLRDEDRKERRDEDRAAAGSGTLGASVAAEFADEGVAMDLRTLRLAWESSLGLRDRLVRSRWRLRRFGY